MSRPVSSWGIAMTHAIVASHGCGAGSVAFLEPFEAHSGPLCFFFLLAACLPVVGGSPSMAVVCQSNMTAFLGEAA